MTQVQTDLKMCPYQTGDNFHLVSELVKKRGNVCKCVSGAMELCEVEGKGLMKPSSDFAANSSQVLRSLWYLFNDRQDTRRYPGQDKHI